jgi:opacity protein-like surface antigen
MNPGKPASVFCLMAALLAAAAVARPASNTTISGYIGLGIPEGPKDFKDFYKTSIGFGAEFRYSCCEKTDVAVSYTRLPFRINQDQWGKELWPGMTDITLSGGKVNTNIFSLNIVRYFTPPAAVTGFYVTAGPGIYGFSHGDMTYAGTVGGSGGGYYGDPGTRVSYTIKGSDLGKSESKFGLNGGLGLDYKLADKWTIFAEGKFHYVFTKSEKNAETGQTGGGKTTFITTVAGIRYSF